MVKPHLGFLFKNPLLEVSRLRAFQQFADKSSFSRPPQSEQDYFQFRSCCGCYGLYFKLVQNLYKKQNISQIIKWFNPRWGWSTHSD